MYLALLVRQGHQGGGGDRHRGPAVHHVTERSGVLIDAGTLSLSVIAGW